MIEWLEVVEMPGDDATLIPLGIISGIKKDQNSDRAWIFLTTQSFGANKAIKIEEPKYAELRALLQPINVVV